MYESVRSVKKLIRDDRVALDDEYFVFFLLMLYAFGNVWGQFGARTTPNDRENGVIPSGILLIYTSKILTLVQGRAE